MVGLNFSNEAEADKFLKAMETKIKDRQQRRQSNLFTFVKRSWWYVYILAIKQRKDNTFNRSGPSSPPNFPAPALPSNTQPTPPRSSPMQTPLQTIPEPSHNISTPSSSNTPSSGSNVNKGHKGGKRKKLSKSDISAPSNFQ